MKVLTSHNNFARAKLDHDMMGRYDLPIYGSGADVFQNFISNFKGNGIYRPAYEEMLPFQDCSLFEFRYSDNQNYLLAGYNTKFRFASYDANGVFGWVLNGGATELEVTTPYTLAQIKQIVRSGQFTQKNDAMIIAHTGYEPRRLIRNSANDFSIRVFGRKNDPFPTAWAATKTITAVTQAAQGVVTSAAHGYAVGDRVKIVGIVGMTQLNDWTAAIVAVPTANTFTIDVDTTTYTAYTSGGTAAKVTAGDYPGCALFYKSRIYYAATPLKPTTVFASEAADYYDHTIPTSPTATSALQFTIDDITERIKWLFGGDNSLIAGSASGIVAINGGGVGAAITAETIEATLTSAEGCNDSYPIRKDGLVFYMGNNNRNMYYFRYDLLTESFIADDANFISFDVTRGGLTKLRYKKDKNDLIYGLNETSGYPVTLNFNKGENVVGWHTQEMYGTVEDVAVITNNNGEPQLFALNKYGSSYYIERQAALVEFAERVMFFTGDAAADDAAYNRYVAEQLKSCIYLDNANTVSDLRSQYIYYMGDADSGTIKVSLFGPSQFTADDVGKHIVVKTITGYESGRFLITAYNSGTSVEVDVLQQPEGLEFVTISSGPDAGTWPSWEAWYLTFSTISGLTQYNGTTIGLVADGGYIADFEVSGAAIDIGTQVTHAVVGYRYRGLIKSFPLGFQVQGFNTQVTTKAITRSYLRTVASAGGKFGSSMYHLEPVQELTGDELNYLPPLPIDGTKDVGYTDDHTKDKFFYIVQDEPLPFHIASLMLAANYVAEI